MDDTALLFTHHLRLQVLLKEEIRHRHTQHCGDALEGLQGRHGLAVLELTDKARGDSGTLGEFNIGQATVARTMRPTLDAIAVTHHTLTDEATMPFIVDKSIKQAFTTQSPVVFILSPLLTGGNPLAAAKLK